MICSSDKNLFCHCMPHKPMTPICTYLIGDSTPKHISSIALDLMGYSSDKMERIEQLQQLGTDPPTKSIHCNRMYISQFYHYSLDTQGKLVDKFLKIRNIFSYN